MTDFSLLNDMTEDGWGSQYDVAEGPDHGLEVNANGEGSFASVRKGAWHKLGTVTDKQVTALELLQLAKADYEIITTPVIARTEVELGDGFTQIMEAEDPYQVNACRINPHTGALQVLGQGSKGKQWWSNRDVFVDFADPLITLAEPTASTCGVIDNGRQAFMCFKLPSDLLVGGVDAVELWMVAHTSFDASYPTTLTVGPVRTVCQNTLRFNHKHAVKQFKIKRTKNAQLNGTQAAKALELTRKHAEELAKLGEKLISAPLSTRKFEAIVADLWSPGEDASKREATVWDAKLGKLLDLYTVADTQAEGRGTAWAAVNAVVEYADWEMRVNATAAGKKGMDEQGYRFWKALSGDASTTQPKDDILAAVLAAIGEPALV